MLKPEGPPGHPGCPGPAGPVGEYCEAAYGGLFNTVSGEFCTEPGEIIAMTFSDGFPAAGMYYDGNHSVVLERDGVYEIQYALRADSKGCAQLCLAITNDGAMIPCSKICEQVACNSGIAVSGVAVTEARAGAHLHFITYGEDDGCFMLHEGVNLMMYVKRLAELPECRWEA